MTDRNQLVRVVTNYAAEYIQRWYTDTLGPINTHAQILLAAGCGPARLSACTQALRRDTPSGDPRHAILRRALSLFRQGELQELSVRDAAVLDLIVSMLPPRRRTESRVAPDVRVDASSRGEPALSQALEGLRAISYTSRALFDGQPGAPAFMLIERFADTIKEVDCYMVSGSKERDQVLARCTRLEILTQARCYTPTVWLGLSQLHTLRGVNLEVAPIGAIASALPQLHTLDAFLIELRQRPTAPTVAVAGFFELLLPRLRSFSFEGRWPRPKGAPPVMPQPLPLLQELKWRCAPADPDVHRGFLGAQPALLHATPEVINDWLTTTTESDGGTAHCTERPFALARAIRVEKASVTHPPLATADVARTLRAAPELRSLIIFGLTDRPPWLSLEDLADAANTQLPFAGVVHARLTTLAITTTASEPLADDCITRLRQWRFPRLQVLKFNRTSAFATPLGC